jgi:hypothetical protein
MRVLSRPKIVAALILAAAAGPLLAPGAASAAPPTVTFKGGCGLLGVGASSQPSTGSVKISADSSVNFVNHLNSSAQLFVNNKSEATVNPDYQVQVSFHASATVALVPSCLLGSGGAGTVSVRVSSASGGSPSGPATAGAPTKAAPPFTKPSATATPSAGQSSAAASALASGAAKSTASPSLAPSGAGVVIGPSSGSGDGQLIAVGATTPAASRHHGPDRLLVVISAVCLIGVSIALIRAIVAQRAIRMVTA